MRAVDSSSAFYMTTHINIQYWSFVRMSNAVFITKLIPVSVWRHTIPVSFFWYFPIRHMLFLFEYLTAVVRYFLSVKQSTWSSTTIKLFLAQWAFWTAYTVWLETIFSCLAGRYNTNRFIPPEKLFFILCSVFDGPFTSGFDRRLGVSHGGVRGVRGARGDAPESRNIKQSCLA